MDKKRKTGVDKIKENIYKIRYETMKADEASGWWTWIEKCDKCNQIIHFDKEMITLTKPNLNEKDYCINCLQEMI